MAFDTLSTVVNVERVSMVHPAAPTPPHFMFLPELDLFWLPIKNVRRVLFFKTDSDTRAFSETIAILRKSLSDVLVEFYPVAGRLHINKETNKPEIECNDAGVEFIEATVDASFQELQQNNDFARTDLCNKLAPPMSQLQSSDSISPLLSLQVTVFAEGGFCIGIAFQHVLGDGSSLWHLVNSWAELSRGLPSITIKPIHDRTMYPPTDINPRISFKAVQAKSDQTGESWLLKFVIDNEDIDTQGPNAHKQEKKSQQGHPENVEKTSFCLSQETIQTLKCRSQSKSTFVAVIAHTWRSIIRARKVGDNEVVCLSVMANCRGRVNPQLPSNYFGNFLTVGLVKVPARRLIGESICFAARLVEECVDSCATQEQLGLTMSWGGDRGLKGMLSSRDFCDVSAVVVVTGSHKFPMYECDFGWGIPQSLEVVEMNGLGPIFMAPAPPPNHHGGIRITTLFPQSQIDDLSLELSRTC